MLRYVIYYKNGEILKTTWFTKSSMTIEFGEEFAKVLNEHDKIERWFIEYAN